MRTYKSFEEIDKDLKYLQLQKEIDQETMKLNMNEVKESLSFVNVAANVVTQIAKKAVVLKTVNKLLGRK